MIELKFYIFAEEKSFEEYFNEYYALEYEDIIGDGLITKFKYRTVPANDFGITIDEVAYFTLSYLSCSLTICID